MWGDYCRVTTGCTCGGVSSERVSRSSQSRADRRAEAAAAMAAAVAAIPDDEYEAMYTGGSMGIEFDATMPGLVVSAVVRLSSTLLVHATAACTADSSSVSAAPHVVVQIKSGASDKSGVKPGDRVVKVNGEELGDKDFREGVQVIMKAEWPKTLQFKRAEVVETKDPSVRVLAAGAGAEMVVGGSCTVTVARRAGRGRGHHRAHQARHSGGRPCLAQVGPVRTPAAVVHAHSHVRARRAPSRVW